MSGPTNFIKLPEDGERQNKGAKMDPGIWNVVPMRDDPSKFKVVDNSTPPINVAHLFNSRSTAQQFIEHHLWIKNNPCPEGQVRNEEGECVERPGGGKDPNGVQMLYANTGQFKTNWVKDGGRPAWDLADPPINMEMTGYFKGGGNDDVSAKIRGGRHGNSDPGTQGGCCYDLHAPTKGGEPTMEIECPHNDYEDVEALEPENESIGDSSWRGYKAIVWNKGNTVHIEMWEDKGDNDTTPGNEWVKLFEIDDTGNLTRNQPQNKPFLDHHLASGKPQCTWRIDVNGTQAKWMSVVELTAPT
jgi:hypothetical protein